MNGLEDARETPEEMALDFTCAMFETPQAVLKGARHMVCKYMFSVCANLSSLNTYFRIEVSDTDTVLIQPGMYRVLQLSIC